MKNTLHKEIMRETASTGQIKTLVSYPVIFSAPMILALLSGRKTQTRRLAWDVFRYPLDDWDKPWRKPTIWQKRHDKFQAGERPWLWTKETWRQGNTGILYRTDDVCPSQQRWTPSIHMPKWASRLSLRVCDMRMESLQDISEEDAAAEGVEPLDFEREERDWTVCPKCGGTRLHDALGPNLGVVNDVDCTSCDTHAKRFSHLWNSINGPDAWYANPEVVVTGLEIHRQNIEAIHG